jgi:hypothetical protein
LPNTETDLTPIYLLGSRQTIDLVFRRIATEWGGELREITTSGGLPALNVIHGHRLGLLIIEELPHARCHAWVTQIPSGRNDEVTEFWNFASQELARLGFLISGTPALEAPNVGDGDGERFSEAEQQEIALRLDTIQEMLLKQYELSHEQSDWVKTQIGLLKEELTTSRRIVWKHLARSALLGIASMVGGQSARLVADQAYEMLRPYLGQWFPFLLGSG